MALFRVIFLFESSGIYNISISCLALYQKYGLVWLKYVPLYFTFKLFLLELTKLNRM